MDSDSMSDEEEGDENILLSERGIVTRPKTF
jgi:hypothetical protein